MSFTPTIATIVMLDRCTLSIEGITALAALHGGTPGVIKPRYVEIEFRHPLSMSDLNAFQEALSAHTCAPQPSI